jgi:hypothetical protein
MITKLKIQVEEEKIIEDTLKERLEEKDKIIGNFEAEIVTLRKVLQNKNMHNSSKVLDNIISIKRPNHDKYELGQISQKMDQAPKQHIKKHIQEVMQRQSKQTRSFTRKITGTLLHREDSNFRISDSQKQEGLKKKKDSEE